MTTADITGLAESDGLGPEFVIELEPCSETEITWHFYRRDRGPVAGEYTRVGGVLQVALDPASADCPVVVTSIDGWTTSITGQLLTTDTVAQIVAEIEGRDPAVLAQLLADGPAARLDADHARVPGLLDAVAGALTKHRAVLTGDLTVLLFAPVPAPEIRAAVQEAYARRDSVEELVSSIVSDDQGWQMPRVFAKHARELQPHLWVTAYRLADGTGVFAGRATPDFGFSPTAPGVVTGNLSEVGLANPHDDPARSALRKRAHDLLEEMVTAEDLLAEDSPFATPPGQVDPADALTRWTQVCGPPLLEPRPGLNDVTRWWSVLSSIELAPGA